MEAAPDVTEKLMTENVQTYIDVLKDVKEEKPVVTENGLKILKYLQENPDVRIWKAKDLADKMGVASRGISGALRKLVNDGYCEKISTNPVVYTITEKGINFKIEGENE